MALSLSEVKTTLDAKPTHNIEPKVRRSTLRRNHRADRRASLKAGPRADAVELNS